MTSGIQDVSGSAAVTALAYELLNTTTAAAPAALAETGVVTGADYASIFRTSRNFDNLGLPAVDGSMDDGRIRSLLTDIVDAVDAAAAERLRNRTSAERAQHGLMLLRLDAVAGGADTSSAASADFSAAVAADPTGGNFTYGEVNSASTSADIDAIMAATEAEIARVQAELAAENAKETPDATIVSALTAQLGDLTDEKTRLDDLSALASTKAEAETSFFGAIFDFFRDLVSFFVRLFTGGTDSSDAAFENALREGGPIDQAFRNLTDAARKSDQDRLAAMIDSVDRRELLTRVREEVRSARAEGRTEVDVGALVVQFAMRFTVEASEGPAPSPVRIPDARTAALEPLRPGNNAPRQQNGPAPSQQPRSGAAKADTDAGLFPSVPEVVVSLEPKAGATDAARLREPDPVSPDTSRGTIPDERLDDTGRGLLGFDARDGKVIADPLLFDSLDDGIFEEDELAAVLELLGPDPFDAAERNLPRGADGAQLRRVSAALAALIESAIAVSDAAEEAAERRIQDAAIEPRRVRLEL